MKKIPSDLTLITEIYNRYYGRFETLSKKEHNEDSKIYIPIDIEELSEYFETDVNIIFGRLYYHLEKKHGYKNDDGKKVAFFTPVIGKNKNAINFPLMISILSGMSEERNRQNITMIISVIAVTISLLSFVLSFFNILSN